MTDHTLTNDPPVARFHGPGPRSKEVKLEWPFTLGDKSYAVVTVHRLTTGEIMDFLAEIGTETETRLTRFPLYRDSDGELLTDAVWRSMDDDDARRLEVAALDFLPHRFRPDLTSPSTPPAGAGSPLA